ncbi:MAG: glycosyltransferase family 2 protein [Deltaproteobacteria bacterium]|nr:glycosyltransferase family 2 protein [Deltaproteobacteria bacterium]
MNKSISIITPCYNEEGNVRNLRSAVLEIFKSLPAYEHEHIFIDNASKDKTVSILREMAHEDARVKVIINTRDFGHIRSPHHAILQAEGDAIIILVADLQDPPELILDFIREWERGYKVVLGVKVESEESAMMFGIRKIYYHLINRMAEIELVKNYSGFGLYDRQVIDIIKKIDDPYPYFRGMVADIGFESAKILYTQKSRRRGITKNNFYTLYDIAMLGITNHSKIPLRFATLLGFASSAFSFLISVGYLIAKLVFWDQFTMGTAPILIGIFFLCSVLLFFIGIIGEYIGAIHTQVLKRPLVVERERIGFDRLDKANTLEK